MGPGARRRRHRRVAALLVALAAIGGGLVVAGSAAEDDEGDEGEPSTTAPLTVAATCRASNSEIATAQAALLRDNESPTAVEGFLGDAFVDLARERASSIRALEPGADVLALLADHDAVVDVIAADPAAAAALEANPFDALNDRWRALDLTDCAIDSSTVVLG